jgi:hypothetical protein
MGEYDQILIGMPRDKAILCLRKLGDNIEPVEQEILDNENGELIKFQAYDFVIHLFESNNDTEKFICLLQKWIENVEWSKKLIASRNIEPVKDGDDFKNIHVLMIRLWVSDKYYADSFKVAANVIRKKISQKLDDPVNVGKNLSSMFREKGWVCKCGHLNSIDHNICVNCLSFNNNGSSKKKNMKFN